MLHEIQEDKVSHSLCCTLTNVKLRPDKLLCSLKQSSSVLNCNVHYRLTKRAQLEQPERKCGGILLRTMIFLTHSFRVTFITEKSSRIRPDVCKLDWGVCQTVTGCCILFIYLVFVQILDVLHSWTQTTVSVCSLWCWNDDGGCDSSCWFDWQLLRVCSDMLVIL